MMITVVSTITLPIILFSSTGNLAKIEGAFPWNRLGRPSLASAGDVNRDGFKDLVYGQKTWGDYPAVFILLGGATFDDNPDIILTYPPPYEGYFGFCVGCAGDVNGDDYADVMVAKSDVFDPETDENDSSLDNRQIEQKIYIYYGGPDMDGEPDIAINDPHPPGSGYEFGHDLCVADLGLPPTYMPDGIPDIVVGCPGKAPTSLRGRVYVFIGPDYAQYVELYSTLPNTGNDGLGSSITSADINNDGLFEIVAGAPYWNDSYGAIVAWDGWGSPMPCWYMPSPYGPAELFGFDVAAGDVNNDEYADLFISIPQAGVDNGGVCVSYGWDGWGGPPIAINQELICEDNYAYFGWSIAHCGDVDNDGIGDVIVGAVQDNTGVGNGYIALYCGDDGGILDIRDLQIYGEAYRDGFGWRVCGAGDMNGDGFDDFAVSAPYNDAGGYENAGCVYVYGELNLLSSDSNALAYNGNRHLARRPNSEELHVVYTNDGEIYYTNSLDGGLNWDYTPDIIGAGKYPAIVLSPAPNYLPSVSWTDNIGGLWYCRQTAPGTWSEVYHIYDPWWYWAPRLNSAPSVVIIGNIVHVIGTLQNKWNGAINGVAEFEFPISDPMQGAFTWIEGGPTDSRLYSNASLTRDFQNRLHATWQRGDTICYATKDYGQTWNCWGPQFGDDGLRSAYPFVETYGDSVFLVWQHKEAPNGMEEVFRSARLLTRPFDWIPFSQTPDFVSLYPVNAQGLVTTFADATREVPPPPDSWYDIYWKIKVADPLTNISETPFIKSTYPQTAIRFNQIADNVLYVIWQEGDGPAYRIKSRKMWVPGFIPAYLTSPNGYAEPSPYLVQRDSFMANWQVPVDVGNQTSSYQIPLEPDYRYKIKVTAYHELSGEWREWVKVDGRLKHLLKYDAYKPEVIEFWLPPAFYQDSVIELLFDRIRGEYATAGQIIVYQLEYDEDDSREEEQDGVMAQVEVFSNNVAVTCSPNPFASSLNIKCQSVNTNPRISIRIYDIAGRLIKSLFNDEMSSTIMLCWDGTDATESVVPQGIYFAEVVDLETGFVSVHKIVKIQ